jgi:hypothetical protein
MLRNNYNRDEVRADSLVYPGVYSLANNAGPLVTSPFKSKYAINSFYGWYLPALKITCIPGYDCPARLGEYAGHRKPYRSGWFLLSIGKFKLPCI